MAVKGLKPEGGLLEETPRMSGFQESAVFSEVSNQRLSPGHTPPPTPTMTPWRRAAWVGNPWTTAGCGTEVKYETKGGCLILNSCSGFVGRSKPPATGTYD